MQHITYLLVLVEHVQCLNRTHGSSISPHTHSNGCLASFRCFHVLVTSSLSVQLLKPNRTRGCEGCLLEGGIRGRHSSYTARVYCSTAFSRSSMLPYLRDATRDIDVAAPLRRPAYDNLPDNCLVFRGHAHDDVVESIMQVPTSKLATLTIHRSTVPHTKQHN